MTWTEAPPTVDSPDLIGDRASKNDSEAVSALITLCIYLFMLFVTLSLVSLFLVCWLCEG